MSDEPKIKLSDLLKAETRSQPGTFIANGNFVDADSEATTAQNFEKLYAQHQRQLNEDLNAKVIDKAHDALRQTLRLL